MSSIDCLSSSSRLKASKPDDNRADSTLSLSSGLSTAEQRLEAARRAEERAARLKSFEADSKLANDLLKNGVRLTHRIEFDHQSTIAESSNTTTEAVDGGTRTTRTRTQEQLDPTTGAPSYTRVQESSTVTQSVGGATNALSRYSNHASI